MTDLLTPSDSHVVGDIDDVDAADRRTFRAATLDDAVAAARSELGPEVELIEAHRVRRGGLGGFFATDLGVEIVAERRRVSASAAPAPIRSTPAGDQTPAATGPATEQVATAIDRLIEQASAADLTQIQTARPVVDLAAPADVVDDPAKPGHVPDADDGAASRANALDHAHAAVEPDQVDVSVDPPTRPDDVIEDSPTHDPLPDELGRHADALVDDRPFEEHLKSALAAVGGGSAETAGSAPVATDPIVPPVADEDAQLDAATFEDRPAPGSWHGSETACSALDDETIRRSAPPTFEPIAHEAVGAIPWWRRPRTAPPPPPPIEASVIETGDTGGTGDTGAVGESDGARLASRPFDTTTSDRTTALERIGGHDAAIAPLQAAALVATDQLVDGVMSIWERSDHLIGRVSVSVTTTDGTTVCVTSELNGGVHG